jgi:hypothetical protein
MNRLSRLLLGLGCVVFLTLFFIAGLSWWLTGNWSPFHLGGLLEEQSRRRDTLQTELEAVNRCAEGKLTVARQVADGDLTLHDAAMRFRQLHTDRDTVLGEKASPDTPKSDEELYQNVIAWVGIILKDDPVRARMTTARLEAELGLMREQPMRG